MQRRYTKYLNALCFMLLMPTSYASENVRTIEPLITQPELVEVVLLCPEGSQHEGELVPNWVTTDEATDYFCNDSTEKTEVGE